MEENSEDLKIRAFIRSFRTTSNVAQISNVARNKFKKCLSNFDVRSSLRSKYKAEETDDVLPVPSMSLKTFHSAVEQYTSL